MSGGSPTDDGEGLTLVERPATPGTFVRVPRAPRGDRAANGPLPSVADWCVHASMHYTLATAAALGVGWWITQQAIDLGRSAGGVDVPQAATLSVLGAVPGVALFWASLLAFTIVVGSGVERLTRSTWAAGVAVAGLATLPILLGVDPVAWAVDFTPVTAWADTRGLAAASLPEAWWAAGGAAGLGYIAGRRADPFLTLAALVVAGYLGWSLFETRDVFWTGALAELRMALSARSLDAVGPGGVMEQFEGASRSLMVARFAGDVLWLMAPMLTAATATRAAVRRFGYTAWDNERHRAG